MEEIGEEDAESQADGESEEDDHMLPHMRAKAKPDGIEDPSSSSSSGEDIDNGEEDVDDTSPLQRKMTSQSLKARHTRAQELAHALRSQIPRNHHHHLGIALQATSPQCRMAPMPMAMEMDCTFLVI